MDYNFIVNKNRTLLKKQLKRFISDEEYLIFLTRIYKNVSCKNSTSIIDRIYDLFQLYYPELVLKISKSKLLVLIYSKKSFERKTLANKWVRSSSIGIDLKQEQIFFLNNLLVYFNPKLKCKRKYKSVLIDLLYSEISTYISKLTPNLSNLLNDDILCALLIERANGIKNLVFKNSNYVQLLGAENSFFSKDEPKYGLIYAHKFIQNSKNKGKAARILSNKISLAIRRDYFK